MKKYLVGVLSIILIIISACSRVSLDIDKQIEDDEIQVSMSASFSNVDTRLYPSTEDGSRMARINFDGVRVIFYNLDNEKNPTEVAYVFDYNIKAVKGNLNGTDYKLTDASTNTFEINEPIKIKKDDYHIYIIAGASKTIREATSVGKPFTLLQSPMDRDEEKFITDGFLMNSIYINIDPIIITLEDLSNIPSNGLYTPSGCSLTPINAFASVEWSPVIKDEDYIIAKNYIFIAADVLNKKYTLLPEYNQEVKNKLSINFPIDANFSGFGKKSLDELSEHFLYQPRIRNSNNSEYFSTYISSNLDRIDSYLILPENTMAADDQYGTVVTRLIIMASIYPKEMEFNGIDIHTIDNRNQLPSWIYFKGEGYTEREFSKLAKESELKSTKTQEDLDVILAYKELTNNGQEYPSNGYHSSNVRYYKNGTNFFTIPIQHFTVEQLNGSTTMPGQYSVVRNTHYKININSFMGLGAASIQPLKREVNYKDIVNSKYSNISITDTDIVESTIEVLY